MSHLARLIPREHGAWGLLFQPAVGGALLAGQWDWRLIPALGLLLLGFMLREPLVIMARQALVWRDRSPKTDHAVRWLLLESAGVVACCIFLAGSIPHSTLAFFVGAGVVMTAVSVWITVRNRQRSRIYQAATAGVLGLSGPFAAAVATGTLPGWSWLLWGFLTLHAVAAILVVHVRLDRRASASAGGVAVEHPRHYFIQVAQLPLAAVFATSNPVLWIPPVFSVLANLLELRRASSPQGIREPLTRVGLRTLTVSLLHLALVIACLWSVAQAR